MVKRKGQEANVDEARGSGEADHESAETGWNLVMVSAFSSKGVGSREDLLLWFSL